MNHLQISGILNSFNVPSDYKETIMGEFAERERTIRNQRKLLGELEEILRTLQDDGADICCPLCHEKLDGCIYCEECHWGFT